MRGEAAGGQGPHSPPLFEELTPQGHGLGEGTEPGSLELGLCCGELSVWAQRQNMLRGYGRRNTPPPPRNQYRDTEALCQPPPPRNSSRCPEQPGVPNLPSAEGTALPPCPRCTRLRGLNRQRPPGGRRRALSRAAAGAPCLSPAAFWGKPVPFSVRTPKRGTGKPGLQREGAERRRGRRTEATDSSAARLSNVFYGKGAGGGGRE